MKRKGTAAGAPAGALVQAVYLFDPQSVRSASEPPEDSARLIWMFISLIRRHAVDYAGYSKEFRRGDRTFKRDIAKLRELGTRYGFTLTARRLGKVNLAWAEPTETREKAAAAAADTLRAVADALGEFVANDVLEYVDSSAARVDPFLRLATPRLIEQTRVAEVYHALRQAWSKRARVRFRYPSSTREAVEERTVEPHLVTYYDGRYYLVAFDARPRTKGWRQFALDRIAGEIHLAGTFEYRPVQRQYRGQDALGLFKSGTPADVTIQLSPVIAEAVTARLWQGVQRIERATGGYATIVFEAHDIGEVVRWAFGFGAQARVIAPPEAVRMALKLAREIAVAHGERDADDVEGAQSSQPA